MPLQVQCPCGKRLQIPDTAAGKKVKCPNCQTLLAIQAPPPTVEIVEDEFEVVEEPKPKAKPALKKPVKAVAADDDDEDDDADRGRDKDRDDDKPKPKSKKKADSFLKNIKASAVAQLGGVPDVDEDEDDDRPRKKKGKKGRKRRKSEDDDDAYWKTPQGMILNGIGLIGLGIGGIVFYAVEEAPRPIGLLVAGILCIGFGIGGIITGITKKGGGKDDDDE
jgi:hypothetical protein